jgi:hypothetical protein
MKRPFGKSLGAHPQTGPVPVQQFDSGAQTIGKHKQMPAERVLTELVRNQIA